MLQTFVIQNLSCVDPNDYYRTFWKDSESKESASFPIVIIGLSYQRRPRLSLVNKFYGLRQGSCDIQELYTVVVKVGTGSSNGLVISFPGSTIGKRRNSGVTGLRVFPKESEKKTFDLVLSKRVYRVEGVNNSLQTNNVYKKFCVFIVMIEG